MNEEYVTVNNDENLTTNGASHMVQNKISKINVNNIAPVKAGRTFWNNTAMTRRKICHAFYRIKRFGWKLFWMAVVLYVAAYFSPELRTKAPVIYQVVDGGMQVMNFIFLWTVRLISGAGNGNFVQTNRDFIKALIELINQFKDWASAL